MPAFFGLDIGSSSVKLVQLSGKTVAISAIAANPVGKVGVDLVPVEQASLTETVKNMLAANKIKTKRCVVAIPESLVFTRVMLFPVMSSPELATAIKFEAEQAIPYPIDKLELSWVVLYKPKGALATEKMRVLVVAVPSKTSNAYVNFMDSLGLEVARVENEIVSVTRSLVTARKLPGVSLIADLGFANTKFVIADTAQIYSNYLSSLGGMAFTRIIADTFKLPINQAEEYKRNYGLDKKQFEGKLFAAVTPVLAGLIGDVKKVLNSYLASYPERKVDRIILTGGGAYLKGLVAEVTEQTGLEVVIGNAFDGLKVAENMTGFGPIYAVAVGLASEED
ncbi:MAG: type IV pilus assembly protein PilM [Patescibacteria group bacterium]|mgnify:FL=1